MGHIMLGLRILLKVHKLNLKQNTPSNSRICEQMLNFFLSSSPFFINVRTLQQVERDLPQVTYYSIKDAIIPTLN